MGLSEIVMRYDLDDSVRDAICKIHESGKNLLYVINDILDLSKIESGHMELVPVEYDTAAMIHDAVNMNITRIGDKPIKFILNTDPSLPQTLYGDELRVRQILNNLLSNAIKYTKAGEVELSIQVLAEPTFDAFSKGYAGRKGDDITLKFTVRDTGMGIRQAEMPQLFDEYEQADAKANRAIEGSGLGLPIMKHLTDLMDGKIDVESEYGIGSSFSVTLKQEISVGRPIGIGTVRTLKENRYAVDPTMCTDRRQYTPLPHAHVLVVDDIEINLEVARGVLEPYQLHVDCVTSGAEAVSLVRHEKIHYDLILMDHKMPQMGGCETVRIIRDEIDTDYARSVPIVAFTASAMNGNREMFLKEGFQDFLVKPIELKKLDDVLMTWIKK
ncbi:MAG: response regulator [Clostridiales Family XIII bacterium]|nr:response regulator [Clostridiales Family XIII bacterium]